MKKYLFILIMCVTSTVSFAQHVLTGSITDESGAKLFSALVYEKGSTNYTISDGDGN